MDPCLETMAICSHHPVEAFPKMILKLNIWNLFIRRVRKGETGIHKGVLKSSWSGWAKHSRRPNELSEMPFCRTITKVFEM